MNIKYISTRRSEPHIDIIGGSIQNVEKLFKILKKIKIKKFKIKSPGLGILANNEPNLYIRWEQSDELLKIVNLINKRTSYLFHKIEKFTTNSLWIPRTTVAWKDLNYYDLNLIFHKVNFLFTNHYAVINYIYLIDYIDDNKLRLIDATDLDNPSKIEFMLVDGNLSDETIEALEHISKILITLSKLRSAAHVSYSPVPLTTIFTSKTISKIFITSS